LSGPLQQAADLELGRKGTEVGSRKRIRYLTAFFGTAAMASLAAVPLLGTAAGAAPAAQAASHTSRMVPAVKVVGKPLVFKTSKPDKHGLFSCQASPSAANPVPCYAPTQIRKAYDIPSKLTGAGETIVIIDAFGNPNIANDLALFDATFGLPAADLNITCIGGTCPTFDPNNGDQVNWAGEIALDTQWAHAIAPGAKIDLVISKSDADADILAAQQYVVDNNLGDVLSQSFGEGETCMASGIFAAQHRAFVQAKAENMTVFASAGDQGASQPDCNGDGKFFLSASTPASDPLVTGVGGTHLNANFNNGAYHSETVWNNSGLNPDFGAGGGGFSTFYTKPSYQNHANTGSAMRGVPDVTYNGDVYAGVLGVCSECNGGTPAFFIFGGTSAGSPQWAAITALADQAAGHRVGFLNPTLYTIATGSRYKFALNDVTSGNNSWDVSGVTGYSAGPGWDPASGLGSPDAAHLISLLTS
jgi:subtilase family serine protease